MLEDGTYSAIVIDADDAGAEEPGVVRVELAVTTGPHKGDVIAVRGRFRGMAAVDLLAEPATVTVRDGRPGVTLDRSG